MIAANKEKKIARHFLTSEERHNYGWIQSQHKEKIIEQLYADYDQRRITSLLQILKQGNHINKDWPSAIDSML